MPLPSTALTALQNCRTELRAALADARYAAPKLYGARATRTLELAEMLADAIGWCERLCFVVEGDLRAEQADGLHHLG